MLTVQREQWVCMCVEERGRGISFNASALVSDSPCFHIHSLSSRCLSSQSLIPYSFCRLTLYLHSVCIFLMSDILYILISLWITQDHTLTSPASFPSSRILAAAPPSQLLHFPFSPWFCSLRQESAADWGGWFESIVARSEAMCLGYFSPSLPLSPPSLLASPSTLTDCQWESERLHVCCYRGANSILSICTSV